MKEKDQLLKALTALYLEVDETIANDIMRIAKEYIKAVEELLPPCKGEPCTCEPRIIKVKAK